MPLAQKLNKWTTASQVLANVDWTELADGSGYVTYQGFASTDTVGTNYILAQNVLNSDPVAEKITNTSTDSNLVFDTTPFNLSRTIKGDIYFIFTQGVYTNNAASIDVTCELVHYDGTTETSLGSKTSVASVANVASPTTDTDTIILKVTSARQLFSRGDILRVNVTVNPTYGSATSNYMFCHDPLNRDASNGTLSITAATNPTSFQIAIPFLNT